MTIWTPPELESNARPFAADLWRVVEAQHTASTMRLASTLSEQHLLESILEDSKPRMPPGLDELHYLLATPFRYRPHSGSRFRSSFESGVWYGGEVLRTSLAEKSYWRLRFLLDSPGTPDLKPVPHTAFQAAVRGKAIDLRTKPLSEDSAHWTNRTSYSATQALATSARIAGIQIIRYESVRDPERAGCAAVLAPEVFVKPKPKAQETWFIAAGRATVLCARRTGPTYEFDADQLIDG